MNEFWKQWIEEWIRYVDPIEYDRIRKPVSKALGARVGTLDAMHSPKTDTKPKKGKSRKPSPPRRDSSGTYFSDQGEFRGVREILYDHLSEYPDKVDGVESEFVNIVEGRVHYLQAWHQIHAFGWPDAAEGAFRSAYNAAFDAWILEVGGSLSKNDWPERADAVRPDDCPSRYLAAGNGDFWNDALDAYIPNPKSFYPSLPCAHHFLPAYFDGDPDLDSCKLKPAKLARDNAVVYPMISNSLAPGYRAVKRVSGLCVESFGDPDRLNAPALCREDRPCSLSPIKIGVYQHGAPPIEYIPYVEDER